MFLVPCILHIIPNRIVSNLSTFIFNFKCEVITSCPVERTIEAGDYYISNAFLFPQFDVLAIHPYTGEIVEFCTISTLFSNANHDIAFPMSLLSIYPRS